MFTLGHVFTLALVLVVPGANAAGEARPPANRMRLVKGDPTALIIQKDDLPAPFAMAGGQAQPGGEYAAIFFRPDVLARAEQPEGDLLGIMASVAVQPDVATAQTAFVGRGGVDADSIARSVGQGSADAKPLSVAPVAPALSGTDDAVMFRVEYVLAGVRVVEYRYRLLVANSVVNLMVSGRTGAGGKEPTPLVSQARHVAERQVARLLAARN